MTTTATTIAPWAKAESQPADLAASRSYCERCTRAAARNFYYGLRLLPEPKRSAMYTLYTYMRKADDITDDDSGRSAAQRAADLDAWQAQTAAVIACRPGAADGHPLWPAFADMVRRFVIPTHVFDDVIAGQRQDLEHRPLASFSDLATYCYRVAGVVGLASIYIWGFRGGEETEALAVKRGIAFQLTNILRDLRSDAQGGRVYIPAPELAAAGVTPADLRDGRGGPAFLALMREQIARAESFYAQSANLDARVESDARPTLTAMTEIYHGLLRKIAQEPERILHERVSLSALRKLRIGWRASWGR